MRRRRGEGGRDRAAHRLGVHRVGGELADRPPRGQHLGRAVPEHVLRGRPDQRLGARAVGLADQVGQAPDDRHRDAGELALDQVGGGRHLVRDGRDRHLKRPAEGVRLAAVVAQRRQPGDADRRVGLAVPPGPAHRVGDHHGHGDAAAGRAARGGSGGPSRPGPRAAAHRARRGV